MKFELPGFAGTHIRLFEKVDTVDPQYGIYDCGVEHADGGIDSLAVGGSAYSLGKLIDEDKVKELAAARTRRRQRIEELEAELKAEADAAAQKKPEDAPASEDEAVGATA